MRLRNQFLGIACLTAAAQACALTLGTPQNPVVLGAPLDVRITIVPDPGQTLDSSCIQAQVMQGEVFTPVRTTLIAPQTLRIRSQQAINEPLVSLTVSAGCSGQISRSYTLFADPPQLLPSTQPAAALSPSPPPEKTAKRPAPAPKAAKAAQAPSAKAPTATARPAPKTTPAPAPKVAPARTPPADPAAAAPLALSITALDSARPVLRMDTLFLFHDGEEGAAANRGESTIALAPADTAAIESERLLQLQTQLASLEEQQKKSRAEIAGLTTELAAAKAANTLPLWLYLLLAVLTAALLAIAYLLQRLRAERQHAASDWHQAVRSAYAPDAEEKYIASTVEEETQYSVETVKNPTVEAPEAPTKQASPAPAPAEPAPSAPIEVPIQPNAFFLPQADNHLNEGDSAEAPSGYLTVTTQDFLDTQEQAEFYASIGEYDEAIILLENHIEKNPKASPLPYLKLLEFFYQLSRTEAFETTRRALEAVFNIQAPRLENYHAPSADLLEGAVPLLTQIEALWPTDDVLALMGGAIHYPTTTPQLAQPLDRLPATAFQELLLLYEIAEHTTASQRGSTIARSSTIAAAQRSLATDNSRLAHDSSAAASALAATPLLDVPHLAGSLEADLPDNLLGDLPGDLPNDFPHDLAEFSAVVPPPPSPEQPPQAEASLPPAPFENTDNALLTDFGLDWPLPSSGEADSAAPTAPAEEVPPPSFDMEGLDFDNFEFKPSTPPESKP